MTFEELNQDIKDKLTDQVPALLFPVRVETCFVRVGEGSGGSSGEGSGEESPDQEVKELISQIGAVLMPRQSGIRPSILPRESPLLTQEAFATARQQHQELYRIIKAKENHNWSLDIIWQSDELFGYIKGYLRAGAWQEETDVSDSQMTRSVRASRTATTNLSYEDYRGRWHGLGIAAVLFYDLLRLYTGGHSFRLNEKSGNLQRFLQQLRRQLKLGAPSSIYITQRLRALEISSWKLFQGIQVQLEKRRQAWETGLEHLEGQITELEDIAQLGEGENLHPNYADRILRANSAMEEWLTKTQELDIVESWNIDLFRDYANLLEVLLRSLREIQYLDRAQLESRSQWLPSVIERAKELKELGVNQQQELQKQYIRLTDNLPKWKAGFGLSEIPAVEGEFSLWKILIEIESRMEFRLPALPEGRIPYLPETLATAARALTALKEILNSGQQTPEAFRYRLARQLGLLDGATEVVKIYYKDLRSVLFAWKTCFTEYADLSIPATTEVSADPTHTFSPFRIYIQRIVAAIRGLSELRGAPERILAAAAKIGEQLQSLHADLWTIESISSTDRKLLVKALNDLSPQVKSIREVLEVERDELEVLEQKHHELQKQIRVDIREVKTVLRNQPTDYRLLLLLGRMANLELLNEKLANGPEWRLFPKDGYKELVQSLGALARGLGFSTLFMDVKSQLYNAAHQAGKWISQQAETEKTNRQKANNLRTNYLRMEARLHQVSERDSPSGDPGRRGGVFPIETAARLLFELSWMPPVSRQDFLDKSEQILRQLEAYLPELSRSTRLSERSLSQTRQKLQTAADAWLARLDEIAGQLETEATGLTRLRSKAGRYLQTVFRRLAILYGPSKIDMALAESEYSLSISSPPAARQLMRASGAGEGNETRELWVRIFPDQISMEQHDPRLTEGEVAAGERYWQKIWDHYDDEAVNLSAWKGLTAVYGPYRAAWVRKKRTPVNIEDRPQSPGGGSVPQFATLTQEETRLPEEQDPARVSTFPDRFALFLYPSEAETVGEAEAQPYKHVIIGNEIYADSDELIMGFTGEDALIPEYDADGQYISTYDDGGTPRDKPNAWLFNFEKAVERGLGFKVPLEESIVPDEVVFSRLVVLGVRTKNKNESAALLENLFDQHHYSSQGMSFLRPGTPTNNTQETTSAYRRQPDDQTSYQSEVIGAALDPDPTGPELRDGQVFGRAMGLDPALFKHIENSGGQSVSNALHTNRVLWHATMGYMLEEILGYADFPYDISELEGKIDRNRHWLTILEPERIDWLEVWDLVRQFMGQHVSARGMIPGIRVGRQPYGVITTGTDGNIRKWSETYDFPAFYRKFEALTDALVRVLERKSVPYRLETVVDDIDSIEDEEVLLKSQERFMRILGLLPTSEAFFNRYGVGASEGFVGAVNSSSTLNWQQQLNSSTIFDIQDTTGEEVFPFTITGNLGKYLRLGYLQWLRWYDQLSGPKVGKLKSREDRFLPAVQASTNYLDWLLNVPLEYIYYRAKRGSMPSRSILYLLLQNSLFNAYWDAGTRILEKIGLKDFRFAGVEDDINDHVWGNNLADLENSRLIFFRALYKKFILGVKDEVKEDQVSMKKYLQKVDEFVLLLSYESNPQSYEHLDKFLSYDIVPPHDDYAPDNITPFIQSNSRYPFLFSLQLNDELEGLSPTDNMTLAEYLQDPISRAHYEAETAPLIECLGSMKHLSTLPTAELERLLAEHVDLCSHRLDAWRQGFFDKILQSLRKENDTDKGSYLGAWGVLYNLTPGDTRKDQAGHDIYHDPESGAPPPVAIDEDNYGFIHAPSLNHAITAAMLHSGYRAKGNNEILEVNLSSRRVRTAQYLIDGIRRGQPLGALLGYRLERLLHEQSLDRFIWDFRQAFPLSAGRLTEQDAPTEYVEANNVPHALQLLENMPEGNDSVRWDHLVDKASGLSDADQDEKEAVLAIISDLEGELDAIGDLAMAEGVYQVAGGNYPRSDAMIRAFTESKPIPEPEIINTPRSGYSLTHRVGLLVSQDWLENTDLSLWPETPSPRALAEPALNAWIGHLVGPVSKFFCQVNYKMPVSSRWESERFSLAELAELTGLQPIDLLFLFPEDIDGNRDILHRRITHGLIKRLSQPGLGGPGPGGIILTSWKINLEPLSRGGRPLSDLIQVLGPLRQLLTASHPLRASDLVHPENTGDPDADSGAYTLAELDSRANSFRDSLEQAMNELDAIVTADPLDYSRLIDQLWRISDFGINSAIPGRQWVMSFSEHADWEKKSELKNQAQAVLRIYYQQQRVEVENLFAMLDPDYEKPNGQKLGLREKIETYQGIFACILGKQLPILSRFRFQADNGEELAAALSGSSTLRQFCSQDENDGPLFLHKWLSQYGRVREQIGRLEAFQLLSALTHNLDFAPHLLQLPPRDNDAWIGATLPENYFETQESGISRHKLSLVLQGYLNSNDFQEEKAFCGLMYDAWTELIPRKEETSGIAFHYNQPNAEAPQAMLLVTPQIPTDDSEDSVFSLEYLLNSVNHTLDMMKLRLIEPDHFSMEDTSQLKFLWHSLPAVVTKIRNDASDDSTGDPIEEDIGTDFNINNDDPLYGFYNPGFEDGDEPEPIGGGDDDDENVEPEDGPTPIGGDDGGTVQPGDGPTPEGGPPPIDGGDDKGPGDPRGGPTDGPDPIDG
jgi:hypothetical protein